MFSGIFGGEVLKDLREKSLNLVNKVFRIRPPCKAKLFHTQAARNLSLEGSSPCRPERSSVRQRRLSRESESRPERKAASCVVDCLLLIQEHRLNTGGLVHLPAVSEWSDSMIVTTNALRFARGNLKCSSERDRGDRSIATTARSV